VLERTLEESKPPLPDGTEKLHCLLATPFRYRPRLSFAVPYELRRRRLVRSRGAAHGDGGEGVLEADGDGWEFTRAQLMP
jgi:hypothetical protein